MIGIGAMVAVLGLSESSKSDLIAQLDRLGTNMLQVEAGTGIGLGSGQLPDEATLMVSRVGPVDTVASVGDVEAARVYKNDLIPVGQTGGLSVLAVDTQPARHPAGDRRQRSLPRRGDDRLSGRRPRIGDGGSARDRRPGSTDRGVARRGVV